MPICFVHVGKFLWMFERAKQKQRLNHLLDAYGVFVVFFWLLHIIECAIDIMCILCVLLIIFVALTKMRTVKNKQLRKKGRV